MELMNLLAVDIVKQLPLYLAIVVGIVLLGVFIAGMRKGFIKCKKDGIVWLLVGVGYVAAYRFIPNILDTALDGTKVAKFNGVIWGGALLLAIVLVVLVGRAILRLIFTPKKVKASASNLKTSSEGFEYELDDVADNYYARKKTDYEITRETSPGILARVAGGFTSVLNVAFILLIIAGVALFVADAFYVKGDWAKYAGDATGEILNKYVVPGVVDFLIVCLVFFIGGRGFYAGTIGVTRTLLVKVGIVLVIVAGLVAPFVAKVNSIETIQILIDRCSKLYTKIDFLPSEVLGKLTVGLLFAIAGVAVILVLNVLLKMLINTIEQTVILRVVDGAFATLIYLALALGLVAVIWSGLYLLDACQIVNIQSLLAEKTFGYECFRTAEELLQGFVDKYLMKFAG